ncbi:hypothetical protein ASE61_15075 [Bosea sp. Root670]|uniref:hypothetical protein n=1 Tax=Bosea sp. Root670 TaxID=1736583 RepID=UPI00071442F0|nr:hypothetical protein [Bosea sp. Root670]KRE02597.1 hypothetical protein ASE61_15075 [Bosea sp. Root670]
MKTIEILSTFDGYPQGTKQRFVAGAKPTVESDYADLLVGKGLARELADEVKPDEPPAASGKPAGHKERRK